MNKIDGCLPVASSDIVFKSLLRLSHPGLKLEHSLKCQISPEGVALRLVGDDSHLAGLAFHGQ
jgi:hypothetical protein